MVSGEGCLHGPGDRQNRKGWRLPSIPELASLIDLSVTPAPLLPPGHPFLTVHSDFYWSATTNVDDPSLALAWIVNFNDATAGGLGKTLAFPAWCVRGGMNADAY